MRLSLPPLAPGYQYAEAPEDARTTPITRTPSGTIIGSPSYLSRCNQGSAICQYDDCRNLQAVSYLNSSCCVAIIVCAYKVVPAQIDPLRKSRLTCLRTITVMRIRIHLPYEPIRQRP